MAEQETVFKINHYYYLLDRDPCFDGCGKKYIPVRVMNILDNKTIIFKNLLEKNEIKVLTDNEYFLIHRRLYFSENLLGNLGFEKAKQSCFLENLLENSTYEKLESKYFLLIIIKEPTNKQNKFFVEKRFINSGDIFNDILKSAEKLIWVEDLFKKLYPETFKETDNLVQSLKLEF